MRNFRFRRVLYLLLYSVVIMTISLPLRVLSQSDDPTIKTIAWSPDSTKIAIGHDNGAFELISASTMQTIWSYPANGYTIYSVAWKPDNAQIAIGDTLGFAHIRNAATGSLLATIQSGESIRQLAWSPDGTKLATTSRQFSGSIAEHAIKIWNATNWLLTATLTGVHTDSIISVSWSPDSTHLASGSADTSIVVWSVSSGSPVLTLKSESDVVTAVAWSPDGTQLATATQNGFIHTWDLSSQHVLYSFSGSGYTVAITWRPDSRALAFNDDIFVGLWGVSW